VTYRKEQESVPPERDEERKESAVSRRSFLEGATGLGAAGVLLASRSSAEQSTTPTTQQPKGTDQLAITAQQRRSTARKIRRDAADLAYNVPVPGHPNNGDEDLYPDKIGSYSKGLPHDAFGEVDLAAYAAYTAAIQSQDYNDFEAITLGNPGGAGPAPGNTPIHKLFNPVSGVDFELQGNDTHSMAIPPAPAFASAWEAGEIVENYWMAHLREVPHRLYGSDPLAAAAIADLNAMSDFRGPKESGSVTAQTLFRESFPGCTVGPYLSQFFWLPQGFGAQDIDPRSHTAAAGIDYMTNVPEYLDRQNGINPANSNVPGGLVYMRNGRDLGQWVHIDVLFQGYFQAFLTIAGLGVPPNPGNPYRTSATQIPFGTFGGPYLAATVCEVATRALRAVWYQKWHVHRRLRPEVFAARVHFKATGQRPAYPIHSDVLNSAALALAFSNNGTGLLPMAFPEGSPTHPAYGAGHATVAGACVTILKALFDCDLPCSDFFAPVEPSDDGPVLNVYGGSDAGDMTIAGELNKIAANVAFGRNTAGVHWRTDGTESLLLGEQVAIAMLRDQRLTYQEPFAGYTFKKFDGTPVTV
jgi:membrane-associated phospholipid phosphatase